MRENSWNYRLRGLNKNVWLLLATGLSLLVYGVDLNTPSYISFSAYYLAPLALAAWFVPDRRSYFLAALVTIESFHNYLATPQAHASEYWPPALELLSKAVLFLFVCYIISYAKHLLLRLERQNRMLERMAFHDRLTGLPNRALFFDRLSQSISQARRNDTLLALLFLDLDGFKEVNDRYGHEAGDELLKVTARHLRASIRATDTPARLGGDEFAVILGDLAAPETASMVADKIIRNLGATIYLKHDIECSIGVSIGIAIYPQHATEIDRLLTAADLAMYYSKQHGKNTRTFFEPRMLPHDSEHWAVLDEAHRLGVPEIDEQHLELVNMLNRLNEAVKNNAPRETLSQMFDDLVAYTDFHFISEEQLMSKYGFSEDEAHKKEHRLLIEESQYLKERLIDGSELLALQSLKDWVLAHILYMDKQLARHILQQTGNKPDN